MASGIGSKDLDDIKKSFQDSMATQMSLQLHDFSSKMLSEMDKKLSDFKNEVGNGNGFGKNKKNFNNQKGQSNQRSFQSRTGARPKARPNSNQNSTPKNDVKNHDKAFVTEEVVKQKQKRINPYFDNKTVQSGPNTNIRTERKNVKEFVNHNRTENISRSIQCECEIVINCIPKFYGATYEDTVAYDKKEALRALKKFDTNVSSKEIRNVRRHPGVQNGDYIRVTVLFGNSDTPSRLAQKAEDANDFSVLQRSLPRDIRERNSLTLSKLDDLNSNRSKNCHFLWKTTTVKGLVILIQEPDPDYVKPLDGSMGLDDQEFHDSITSPKSHPENLKDLNNVLLKNGANPMTNIPEMSIDEYLDDLAPKYGGINKAMITDILKNQGMKSKEDFKIGKKGEKTIKGATSRA